MRKFKKKNIKKYKVSKQQKNEIDEIEEIDELVNSMGGDISGDKPTANNTEIETAPQATTDDFADVAIQPNRRLFNAGGAQYSKGLDFKSENNKIVAKNKMIKLLEDIASELDNSEKMNDINNNNIPDIKELSSNVANKVTVLVDSISKNNLNSQQITIILSYILQNIGNKLESNDVDLIKNYFNAK